VTTAIKSTGTSQNFWIRNSSHSLLTLTLFCRFKSDRDEIWQDCSQSKHASIDGVVA